MSSSTKSHERLNRLVEALEEDAIDAQEARDTVARLGIDVMDMAAKLRATIAAASAPNAEPGASTRAAATDAAARRQRFDEARRAYARELELFESRKAEPTRPRAEQLVVLQSLLARAPQSVAMHFHKYESASDDELAELVRSLRHLLDEPDDE